MPDDQPISAKPVSKTLEAAQKRVEGYNFDHPQECCFSNDNVINRHRKVVYSIRRKILQGDDISPENSTPSRCSPERIASLIALRRMTPRSSRSFRRSSL